ALWQVTCANGFTQLTNTNLTDVRTEAVLNVADNTVDTDQIVDDAVTKGKIDFASGVWWEELGRATVTSASSAITVDNLPPRKYLKLYVIAIPTGGTIRTQLRFNNDSGNNYASKIDNPTGGGDSSGTSQTSIF